MSKQRIILTSGSYCPPHVGHILPLLQSILDQGLEVSDILISVTTPMYVRDKKKGAQLFAEQLGDQREELFKFMIKSLRADFSKTKYHGLLDKVQVLPNGHDEKDGKWLDQAPSEYGGHNPCELQKEVVRQISDSEIQIQGNNESFDLQYAFGNDLAERMRGEDSAVDLYKSEGVTAFVLPRNMHAGMSSSDLNKHLAGYEETFKNSEKYEKCPAYYDHLIEQYNEKREELRPVQPSKSALSASKSGPDFSAGNELGSLKGDPTRYHVHCKFAGVVIAFVSTLSLIGLGISVAAGAVFPMTIVFPAVAAVVLIGLLVLAAGVVLDKMKSAESRRGSTVDAPSKQNMFNSTSAASTTVAAVTTSTAEAEFYDGVVV